jgi:hypothetical protein
MVYFAQHNENGKLLPIEKACIYKDLYVSGLQEHQVLYSNEPFYIQDINGLMVGVNEHFTRFYIMNDERYTIQTLYIEWSSSCELETKIDTSNQADDTLIHIPIFLGIMILSIICLVYRVARCVNHV